MKKSIYSLLAILAAFMVFSCAKSEMVVNENEGVSGKSLRTITLQFPSDPEAKVSLAEDGKTAWQAGDQILIHGQKMGHSGETYYSRVVTLAAGDIHDEGKTATFTLEDIVVNTSWTGRDDYKATMFAAYPASSVKSVPDATSWYYSTGFDQTQSLLLGGCNNTSFNKGNTFTFYNLSGVLSFVVNGDFDSYAFTGNGSEVVDYDVFAVRVDTESSWGDKNAIPYTGSSGIKCSGEKTSLSGSVVADGSTVNYLYFPGGVNLTSGFTIKFMKGGVEQKRISTNTAMNIARGKYLKLGNVSSHLKNPPAHEPAAWTSGAANLVDTNPANCYIVYHEDVDGYSTNAGKAFKIPAVKGKSSTSVGAIASVSVLWETYNTTDGTVTAKSVVADVDYDASYVYFKMPAHTEMHTGNALIAAKDAMGTILWSWHIWVPSSVVTPITNANFSSTAVMDRNLGAIEPVVAGASVVPVSSFGLYYQWGRKDPFITSDWKRNASVSFSVISDTWVSTETAIQNPTVLYKKKDTTTDPDTYNWNSSEISTLWDEGEHAKTIYDPCPEGYKVGAYDSNKRMWKNATTDWTQDTTYGWLKYSDTITFPLAGYTEDLNPYKVKERSILWSATYKNLERAQGLYTSPLPSYDSYYKFYAVSVRCVAE